MDLDVHKNVAVKMEQTVITLVVHVFALQDGGEDTAARPVLQVSMASIVKIFVIVPMGQNVAMLMGIVNVPQGGWETVVPRVVPLDHMVRIVWSTVSAITMELVIQSVGPVFALLAGEEQLVKKVCCKNILSNLDKIR